VPAFYATNRAALIEKPEPIHLTLASSTLRMGVAHVRVGDETLDWGTLHRLSTSAAPDQRGLEAQSTGSGKRYWGFPADYDRRVVDIIRTAIRRIRPPVSD